MSGRTLHERDGELITNRKTDRRQSPRRPLADRLRDLTAKCNRRFPSRWRVRVGFLLPKSFAGFVADGPHGVGINVFRGFVHVAHGSSEECFASAADFLATVAKGRPAFSTIAVITSLTVPDCRFTRWLTVVNGALVVSNATREPLAYEGRAA